MHPDDRLRSGGFEIAFHDRYDRRLWRMHSGSRMFTPEEALAAISKLIEFGYIRDGYGGWRVEGTTFTLPQALENVERIEEYRRHHP